jgi:hypothetical protein
MINIAQSRADLINQHNNAIAQYALQVKYAESIGDADLIHDFKHLYETEKQRLIDLWERLKKLGEEFFKEVVKLVKDFAKEVAQDIIAFLKRHGLNEIIELIKELF